jgi:hypothetical protein
MAAMVQNIPGSIACLPLNVAVTINLSMAAVRNSNGQFTLPTPIFDSFGYGCN